MPQRDLPRALPMQTREMPIGAVDAEARTVDVVFSTGAAVRRRRWVGWDTVVPFDETLVVSRSAVNLDRLNAGGPVLDSHSTWSTFSQVGVVERAWIDGSEARATIRFPSAGVDETADRMWSMVSERIIRNVSVGYTIDEARVVEAEKKGQIEQRIVERWTPHEISFVTIPADAGAQVRAADQAFPTVITRAAAHTQETSMPEAAAVPAASGQENPPAPETRANPPAAAPAVDLAAERRRSAEINTLAQRHGMPADFATQHIEQGTSLDQVRELVLNAVAERSQRETITSRVDVLHDEGDTIRAAVENAILHRASPTAVKLDDAARQWRGMPLMELGRTFVEETQGIRLRGFSKNELAGVLLGLDDPGLRKRAGMMSTSDFPLLLANVASKRLRDAYGTARQTWKPFSRQSNAPDFKDKAVVALNGIPELIKVREGGEFKYASLGETSEKYALATYGRIVPITRQTLINDDLSAFDRLPSLFGRAAAELESDLVWGVLLNSHLMSDGVELFHANHGNLAGSGAAPDETTVNAGEIAIGAQKDAAGKPLNLPARFLAVSRKHKLAALKLNAAVTAGKTADVNVYQNTFDIIVEDRLYNAGGASPWFMIGDPAQYDTLEYAYLEGEEGLFTETRMGFEVDGIEVKGRLDFAAKAIDWRSFYKNPGN